MDALAALAPTINQGSRRLYLTRAVVYLSRELVLNDGFGRMDHSEIAAWLKHFLQQLQRSDEALRVGFDLEIGEGADQHNPHHNEIMYKKGCPWRAANHSQATITASAQGHRRRNINAWTSESAFEGGQAAAGGYSADPKRVAREWLEARRSVGVVGTVGTDGACDTSDTLKDVAQNDLYPLYRTFFDAVERVLIRYGPEEEDYATDFKMNPRPFNVLEDEYFKTLHVHPARMLMLERDPDVVFILHCFDGDLFVGFEMVVEIFNDEINAVMEKAIEDNKLLFCVYLAVSISFAACSLPLFLPPPSRACAQSLTHFLTHTRYRVSKARVPSIRLK